MVSCAALRSRKTAPVFSVFSNPFSMNVVRAVTVTGAAEMAETSLINTEKVFHGWADSLQGGAFQQLVTYAQERYRWITCSKMWIFARFAKAMIFACLQIFGVLRCQIILMKRSASQVSALGLRCFTSYPGAVPNLIHSKALTISPGEIA